MDQDADRWNDRYRDAPPVMALAPEPLDRRTDLRALIPTTGTAIDVACGLGAQSLWLAARGLQVIALDVSPLAIDRVRSAAHGVGLDDHIDARELDLDNGLPNDLPLADVIVCQRFRHPQLYQSIVEQLRPAGIVIITVLSEVGLPHPPGPFHAPAGELTSAFDRNDLDLVYQREADGAATVMAKRH